MRIVHIITALGNGGAEMMLLKLLSHMDRNRFESQVISLVDGGNVGEGIANLGIRVRTLRINGRIPSPVPILSLARWLRHDRPDMIQTWMYDADLLGGIVAKIASKVPVVWGVRHTNLDPSVNRMKTIRLAKICARLSRWLPSRIVYCSQASLVTHERLGYACDKTVMIPNGFDLEAFSPDGAGRDVARQRLGIPFGVPVIGLVGRWHPQKDHANFFRAARLLVRIYPESRFVLCGSDITWDNAELVRLVDDAGIRSQTHLLGWRDDIPLVDAALDIASSSSLGESFPNVVGEAMACAVPCVVTDVGDSATIVGDTGQIVPARQPEALAKAWQHVLEMPEDARVDLGLRARARVAKRYDIRNIAEMYAGLYEEVANS